MVMWFPLGVLGCIKKHIHIQMCKLGKLPIQLVITLIIMDSLYVG